VNSCAGTISSPHASVNQKAPGHVWIYNFTLLYPTSDYIRLRPRQT
jgi:hypothetical protein